MATPPPALPLTLKAGWGIGSVGTQVVLFSQSLLLLYFFTAILGLQPALAGTLLFSAKLVDALIAPLVGNWSDRAVSRFGRRRPFLLAGAVFCALGLVEVFNPPLATPVFLVLGLALISLGYSFFNIPYLAMSVEMTDLAVERTSLMSWRIACVGIGTIVATALLPLVARIGGGNRHGYGLAGIAAASVVLLTMLAAFFFTRSARATAPSGTRSTVAELFAAVMANQPFRCILLAKVLQLVGLAVSSASMLFFFKDVVGGGENMLAIWGVAANLVSILSMLFWPAIGRRFGKVPVYALCAVGFAVIGFSWLLVGAGSGTPAILLRAVISGVFVGGLLLMGQSLIPDAIAEDYFRSGLRREGIFAGAYSFVEKGSTALGPLIVGFIFQLLGFATHGAGASQNPLAVYLAVAVIPPAAYLLSAWPVLRIRLQMR